MADQLIAMGSNQKFTVTGDPRATVNGNDVPATVDAEGVYTWTTSDDTIATVVQDAATPNQAVVTSKAKAGTCQITLKWEHAFVGIATSSFTVEVDLPPAPPLPDHFNFTFGPITAA